MTNKRIEELSRKIGNSLTDEVEWTIIEETLRECADEQKAKDKELIDELIAELYTSRAYHLGITGLDSQEEIKRKEREGDCALIRGIDRTIKYVKEAMKE